MKSSTTLLAAIVTVLFIALTFPMLVSGEVKGNVPYHLVINGMRIPSEQVRIYVSKQQEIMIPIREVVQQLGYRLTWKNDRVVEVIRGKQHLLLKIGEDRYGVGPLRLSLGAAPELTNGKTYVPLSFLDEVLKTSVTVDQSGRIAITSEETQTGSDSLQIDIYGTVGKIVDTVSFPDGTIQVTVKGRRLTEHGFSLIKLNITSETQIIGTKGNRPLSPEALKKGELVYAFYGPKLTKSIPPIGTAQIIIVENRSHPGHL